MTSQGLGSPQSWRLVQGWARDLIRAKEILRHFGVQLCELIPFSLSNFRMVFRLLATERDLNDEIMKTVTNLNDEIIKTVTNMN